MEKINDKQSIDDLRSGLSDIKNLALKRIYSSNYGKIEAYILKNNGTPEDAADIFQDAMIVFYEKIRKEDFILTSSISTYLYAVGKNLWYNKLRNKKILVEINDDSNKKFIHPSDLKVIEQTERKIILLKLVNRLGNDCRKVLIRYYFDRYKMKDIAQEMNFANEQVAKNKKSNCMKKLKQIIQMSPMLKDILT